MGALVPPDGEAWTGLRDGPQRADYGDSAFLALEDGVTLYQLGDLGPIAHLTNEEDEAQRSHVTHTRSHSRACIWSPGLQTSLPWLLPMDPRLHDHIPVQVLGRHSLSCLRIGAHICRRSESSSL